MADRLPGSDANGDANGETSARPGLGSPAATPRWVKVFAVIAIHLVLVFLIMHLTGGGLGNHLP